MAEEQLVKSGSANTKPGGNLMSYFVGMDIHKRPLVYHVLDRNGATVSVGQVLSTRSSLEDWARTLPTPWVGAMETTLFTQHVHQTLVAYAER